MSENKSDAFFILIFIVERLQFRQFKQRPNHSPKQSVIDAMIKAWRKQEELSKPKMYGKILFEISLIINEV